MLQPVCEVMHCLMCTPLALRKAMPLAEFMSAMQLMNSKSPLELVVPPPVHLLPKPALPLMAATPRMLMYVPVRLMALLAPRSTMGSSQG